MLKQLKNLMQQALHKRLEIKVSRSAFFSESWYKEKYSDALTPYVQSAMAHYLTIGWQLGFDPAPNFSTNGYLALHPDVKDSGVCPLLHYLSHGLKENRAINAVDALNNLPSSLYEGAIDGISSGYIQGWIYSKAMPDEPVAFKLLLDDVEILRSTANIYREDISIAGFGNGHAGFCCLNQLLLAESEGKVLQLTTLNNDKVGGPFIIPSVKEPDLEVKAVCAESFLLVFDIVVKSDSVITFQLFHDDIYFLQSTKTLYSGTNKVSFPVSPVFLDSKAHSITLGMLGVPLALLHQDLTVQVDMEELEHYSSKVNINQLPVIIMIDRSTPKPDQDAGSYAALQEISLIQSLGFHVVFIPDDFAFSSNYTHNLQCLGVEVLFSPIYESKKEALLTMLPRASAVYITRYYNVEKHINTIKSIAPNIPIIFNNADLHFLREIRHANVLNDDVMLNKALNTKKRELAVMDQVDAILSYSEFEHAVITSHTLQSDNIHKCPWVVESPSIKASFDERHDIAFLGGYEHLPNIEAVRYFIEEVMPLIREEGYPIKVYIYGSKMPLSFYDYACEDVIIKGYVESLDSVYLKHRVFIAPLFFGAGVKGKVLSAASYGLPCVLSPIAIEATGLVHNVSALVAKSTAEWAKYTIRLHNHKQEWICIQENQAKVINDNYSFEKSQSMMRSIFKSLNLLN